MKQINQDCIKQSAKQLLKNATQIIKESFNAEKNKNDTNLLNTGCWQIRNFTRGCPGV